MVALVAHRLSVLALVALAACWAGATSSSAAVVRAPVLDDSRPGSDRGPCAGRRQS